MALATFVVERQVQVGDDVYVFKVDCNCDASLLAAGTSEQAVGVLDPSTLQLVRKLEGHTDGIEDVSFFQGSPSCLASCSRDGTARAWDLRAADATARKFELKTDEAYSCSVGCGDTALACGAGHKVFLFDLGRGKTRSVYKDCHTDTVNHVRFHPVDSTRLLTGSLDNLIALLNTSEPKADEALVGVIPNDECVQSFVLVGPDRNTLCSVSTTEQVRIWGLGEADFGTRRAEFLGIRDHPLLAREESLGYVVQTFYDQPSGQVLLLAGTGEDSRGHRELVLFRVSLEGAEPIGAFSGAAGHAPGTLQAAGHTGMVRSAVVLPGGIVVTAGEDSLICAWRERAGGEWTDGAARPRADGIDSGPAQFALEPTSYSAHRGAAGAAPGRAAPY